MNYKDFKKMVEQNFLYYMPERYKNMEIKLENVCRVKSGTLDSFSLTGDTALHLCKGKRVYPALYITDMYIYYVKNKEDFPQTMQWATRQMLSAIESIEGICPNIVFQLVNTELNSELLETVPHRDFLDLSIIYRIVIDTGEKYQLRSTIVRNDLAKHLGLTEDQLYALALENTKKLLPPVVEPLTDVIDELRYIPGLKDILKSELDEIEMPGDNDNVFVLSNSKKIMGAAYLLYEEVLHSCAERFGTDIYILPSSIHELTVVGVDNNDPSELIKMVREVNLSSVIKKDILSNQVYHYDKDLRKLSFAFTRY